MTNLINLLAVETTGTYTCGGGELTFSGMLPYSVHLIITVIKIVVPILLVVFGLLDLAKAVMAQKEDEIKKGQQTLIKRAIAAIIVFFVVSIVQVLIRFASGEDESVTGCFDCFVNANCSAAAGGTVSM